MLKCWQVFFALERSRESLTQQGVKFDLWLNVEAFEYLRDDPCLPVDISASGMGELLNRASKSRCVCVDARVYALNCPLG